MRAAALAICSVVLLGGIAAPAGAKQKRKKPTCTQLNTATLQTVAQLKPVYGAATGGADGTCTIAGRYSLAGGATIGRRDPSPTCTTTACCPATDCIHTNWSWTEILTRNKKGKLVTAIANFTCRRFQVLNAAPGGPTTSC